MTELAYHLDRVSKSYGKHVVLDDITCAFSASGITAILGASGTGKSTLLRMLAFLEMPDKGDLTLSSGGDTTVDTFFAGRGSAPWPFVTCVFQRQFLWPHLTVRQNIELPLRLTKSLGIREKVSQVEEMFDMSAFIERFPNEISVGQAQRGALARAFVLNAKVLLLDEPHTALDLAQQSTLNMHLDRLRALGIGILAVTHALDFAERWADRILVLEGGKIVDNGPVSLLKNPRSQYLKDVSVFSES